MAASDDELTETLVGLFQEIDGHFGTASRRLRLTPQQAQLLCFAQHLRPSFGELATLLHCDKTNITGLVDRLQRRGLLTRRTDPNDRRITRVHLTPEGQAATRQVHEAINPPLPTRFSPGPSAERDSLVHLLQSAAAELRR